jgi:hypothetical protein
MQARGWLEHLSGDWNTLRAFGSWLILKVAGYARELIPDILLIAQARLHFAPFSELRRFCLSITKIKVLGNQMGVIACKTQGIMY